MYPRAAFLELDHRRKRRCNTNEIVARAAMYLPSTNIEILQIPNREGRICARRFERLKFKDSFLTHTPAKFRAVISRHQLHCQSSPEVLIWHSALKTYR